MEDQDKEQALVLLGKVSYLLRYDWGHPMETTIGELCYLIASIKHLRQSVLKL